MNILKGIKDAAGNVVTKAADATKAELRHQWELEKKSIKKNFVPDWLQDKPKGKAKR